MSPEKKKIINIHQVPYYKYILKGVIFLFSSWFKLVLFAEYELRYHAGMKVDENRRCNTNLRVSVSGSPIQPM